MENQSSKFSESIDLKVSQTLVPYIEFDLSKFDQKTNQSSLRIESRLIMNTNKDNPFANAKFETNFSLASKKDSSPYFQATIDIMLLVKNDLQDSSEVDINQLKEAIDTNQQFSKTLKNNTSNMLINVFSDSMFKATGNPVVLNKEQIEHNMLH